MCIKSICHATSWQRNKIIKTNFLSYLRRIVLHRRIFVVSLFVLMLYNLSHMQWQFRWLQGLTKIMSCVKCQSYNHWTGILIRTSRITSRSYLLVNTCIYYIVDCLKLVINTNKNRFSNLEVGHSRARLRNCNSSSTLRYRGCTLLRGPVLERNDRLVLLSF